MINSAVARYICGVIVAMTMAAFTCTAQELKCRVEVNTDKVSDNATVFETLQEAITEYMNTTKFTNATFSPAEKIDCTLFLTVNEYTDDIVKGDLQIQSTRPVYNSAYTTTMLNLKDTRIEFEYRPYEPLVFSENTMIDNLTAILNYYAYLIIAVDFDSFAPMGGDPYFDRLETIVQLAQSSGETGWKAFEDNRNRWAVLSTFTDPSTSGIRNLLYTYHRKGLDEMVVSPDKSRATITEALETLRTIYQADPMTVGLTMWRDAKLDELVNIYSQGSQSERNDVYNLLMLLYPTEGSRLDKIKNPPTDR